VHPSLWALYEGNLEGGSFTGDTEGYVKEGSGAEYLSIGAPLDNLEGGPFTGDVERWMKEGSRSGAIQNT
jgi:hypothetical protein